MKLKKKIIKRPFLSLTIPATYQKGGKKQENHEKNSKPTDGLLSLTLPATYQMQGELNPFTRTHHGVVDKVPHSGGGGGGPLGYAGAPGGLWRNHRESLGVRPSRSLPDCLPSSPSKDPLLIPSGWRPGRRSSSHDNRVVWLRGKHWTGVSISDLRVQPYLLGSREQHKMAKVLLWLKLLCKISSFLRCIYKVSHIHKISVT